MSVSMVIFELICKVNGQPQSSDRILGSSVAWSGGRISSDLSSDDYWILDWVGQVPLVQNLNT